MSRDLEGKILRLGGLGDGVMETPQGPVFVPYTLPGETVSVRLGAKLPDGGHQGELREVIEASPNRIEPSCPHFHACGGCTMQHMAVAPYGDWKRARVVAALERNGLPVDVVAPLFVGAPAERRRIEPSARRLASGTILGFAERGSHRIVDLGKCTVARPELVRLFAPLRACLNEVLAIGDAVDLMLTCTDNGVDLLMRGKFRLDAGARQKLGAFAAAYEIARVSVAAQRGKAPEEIVRRLPPKLRFGTTDVVLSPGVFLQATRLAEAEMQRLVVAAAMTANKSKGARRIGDLFSGIGTFALALVASGAERVIAADGDAEAVAALKSAVNAANLAGRVVPEARDLTRRPLVVAELNELDAVVFDPPRAGAREQASQLARSKVPLVIAVSCNPGSFARDAKLLVEGGYKLESVVPIDQFIWSPHVELVAVLRR